MTASTPPGVPTRSPSGCLPERMCGIFPDSATDGSFTDYRRGVDFETGRAWVEWVDQSAKYEREIFVSRVTDEVFLRIKADKPGAVSCRLWLDKAPCEQTEEKVHSDSLAGNMKLESGVTATADTSTVSFEGVYPNGFSFGAQGYIDAPGGTVGAA